MREKVIKRVSLNPDGSVWKITQDGQRKPMIDRTDWNQVDAMTEEEIEAAALADPDNPPLTEEELKKFTRVRRKL
jgi:hypothetical protein